MTKNIQTFLTLVKKQQLTYNDTTPKHIEISIARAKDRMLNY